MIELGRKAKNQLFGSKVIHTPTPEAPESRVNAEDAPLWPFDWDRRTRIYSRGGEVDARNDSPNGQPSVWEVMIGRRLGADQVGGPDNAPRWLASMKRYLDDAETATIEGRCEDALRLYMDAEDLVAKPADEPSLYWRNQISNRASQLLAYMGRPQEAEGCLQDAIDVSEKLHPLGQTSLASVYHELGLLHREMRKLPESMKAFTSAIVLLDQPEMAGQRAASHMGHGLTAAAMADYEMAAASFLAALDDLNAVSVAPSRQKLEAKICAASAMIKSEHYLDAVHLCRQALEMRTLIFCEGYDEAGLWNMLGFAFARKHHLHAAIKAYRSALRVLSETKLPRAADLIDAHFNLAVLYSAQGNDRESDMHLGRAAEMIDEEGNIARERDQHFRSVLGKELKRGHAKLELSAVDHVLMFSEPISSRR
jgi:tetratricopeptide (TPR) repeat protein